MKKIFVIALILSFSCTYAQNYDFGKVSKEELEEKYHPGDSLAVAAVLYKNEQIKFVYSTNEGFVQQRKIHERIKIYNKEGFDWATKKIYLYKGADNSERITSVKGFTYSLVDGKVNKDKLTSDGKFLEDYNDFLKVSSFTMPNVKEGVVIEYRYTVSTGRASLDDIIVQYNIPINKLEVNVSTPEYYVYNKQLNPRASYIPKVLTSTRNTTVPFDYRIDITKLDELNIPALKEEAFAGNLNNYRSRLSFELSAYLNSNKIVSRSFSQTWEEVCKTIYQSSNFGVQLDKKGFYKEDIENLLSGIDSPLDKARLIEGFVKSKVKWNGRKGKYTQKGIRAAYKEGEGNVADINLLLVSMLRSQGINADPVLISTRDNDIPVYPTLNGFNYVICAVKIDTNYYLFDATEKYTGNSILPIRALNWQGRLIKENGISGWINILPNRKSVESSVLSVKLDEDFVATGKVAQNYTSYLAYTYRNNYVSLANDAHVKKLEEDKGDIEISNLDIKNGEDISKPVQVKYDYELTDGIDEVGDKLYFSPLLFMSTKENPFKLEERSYPIDFIIPFDEKFLINIMIPEGFKVESLPETEAVAFKDSDAKFVYVINENGKFLQLKVQLEINNPLILPTDYKDFKAFYSKVVEKQGEQIVLSRI